MPGQAYERPESIGVGGERAMPGFALLAHCGLVDAVIDADLPLAVVVDALDGVLSGRRELSPPGRPLDAFVS